MEADINEPKSKAFNVYLRFFQLGFQISLAYWAVVFDGWEECQHQYLWFAHFIGYGLIAIFLTALIVLSCSDRFPRCCFFLTFIIGILASAGIVALSVMSQKQQNNCASNQVLQRFYEIEPILAIVISFLILFTKLTWGQRYSNHPGNIAWIFLFLIFFNWTEKLATWMLILGLVNAFITLTSFLVNLMACSGTSSTAKRVIVIQWIIALILMIGCEVFAAWVYFFDLGKDVTEFKDVVGQKVLIIFLPVNLIDFFFWVWGLRTLTHENGDRIRDALFSGEEKQNEYEAPEELQEEEEPKREIGTILN